MELKREIDTKKIYLIENGQKLLETGRVGAEFVIYLYTDNPITITQNLDEYLYSNLNQFNLKLSLDIGNYRAKKIKNLEREIKNICKEVLNTKVEVKLDPMNSYERRIVHSIVSEFEDLQSISEGVEPHRYTIIKIKD